MIFLKMFIGAVLVLLIDFFAKSKNYYIVGILPLFPTFALISHIIVGAERTVPQLKETILFSIFSLIPYFVYLISVYFLVDHYKLSTALFLSIFIWIIMAIALVLLWKLYFV